MEFIGWALLLVLPVVYLVVALAQVQAASFAVAQAADAASRILEVDASPQAQERARFAVALALADQHVPAQEALTVQCAPAGCAHGVVVRVEVGVDLPLLSGIGRQAVRVDTTRSVDLAQYGGGS